MINFSSDIRYLKGVGEKRANILYSMGIDTVGALLRYYPRNYEDFSVIKSISSCEFEEKVCLKAKIVSPVTENYIRKNMTIYKFNIFDGSGYVNVSLFNNKYLASKLHLGSTYLFLGKISGSLNYPTMASPLIRECENDSIEPIYPATSSMPSSAIKKLVKTALFAELQDDPIPQSIRERNNLCELGFAIQNIHFPKTKQAFETAKRRLVFEELFILGTSLMLLKGKSKSKTSSIISRNVISDYYALMPFELTNSQKNSINDCINDMKSGFSMNRLIEGDVGCGKTAVAGGLMFLCAKNGYQSALMAPTEVLATQHFANISATLEGTGINICLLTGSVTKKQKNEIKEKIKTGFYDIIIGTHAILTEDTVFCNLALVITDEQHRFGVKQRGCLSEKGNNPHTLVMSATPIPRTLGLIIYGDLDLSVINEYPKGRQEIETYLVDNSYSNRVYNYIKNHLDEGRQGYIVCPLIDENDESNLKSANDIFERLSKKEFKDYRVGLLHGKMKPKEKEKVMNEFSGNNIDLLISTTVIEVGIDIPNATIMVIENAERFGLSQLHQLRGRIGRGKHKSTCILISDSVSPATKNRLGVIVKNRDGFKIADEDLSLRGPGDFLGNRQHGLPELRIADLFADNEILKICEKEASNLLKADPKLKSEENFELRKEIIAMFKRLNEN